MLYLHMLMQYWQVLLNALHLLGQSYLVVAHNTFNWSAQKIMKVKSYDKAKKAPISCQQVKAPRRLQRTIHTIQTSAML